MLSEFGKRRGHKKGLQQRQHALALDRGPHWSTTNECETLSMSASHRTGPEPIGDELEACLPARQTNSVMLLLSTRRVE